MKNKIKLNESQLRNIIRESVKKILSEAQLDLRDEDMTEGFYVCVDTNYSKGCNDVWITNDVEEAMEANHSSEGYAIGPFQTYEEAEMEAKKQQ